MKRKFFLIFAVVFCQALFAANPCWDDWGEWEDNTDEWPGTPSSDVLSAGTLEPDNVSIGEWVSASASGGTTAIEFNCSYRDNYSEDPCGDLIEYWQDSTSPSIYWTAYDADGAAIDGGDGSSASFQASSLGFVYVTFTVEDDAGYAYEYSVSTNSVNVVAGDDDMICPIDDATGSRYRKIGLNGRPMPDSRPHQEAETDEQKEETYVDALTLGLRHSTTDIYIPIPGSALALSVRRNVTSENWNDTSGLRPAERLDRPFGACWTSNLSPTIDYTHTADAPDTFYVTDESGAQHRFIYAASGIDVIFCPVPTSGVESTYECGTLKWSGKSLVYTGKFGNVISFEQTLVGRSFEANRKHGGDTETHYYYRATSIIDRVGTEIDYSYDNPYTVIPTSIYLASNPSQRITITSGTSSATYRAGNQTTHEIVVKSIKDPNGNTWNFGYQPCEVSDGSIQSADGAWIELLTSVTRPDNSTVMYTYNTCKEADTRDWIPGDYKVLSLHCDISSIFTQVGWYGFDYNLDQSKYNHSAQHGYYKKTGLPRNLASVMLPNGSHSWFQNISLVGIYVDRNPYAPITTMMPGSYRETMAWDALGNRTVYDFNDPCPVEAQLDEAMGYAKSSRPVTVYYKGMSIGYPYGTETYTFDIAANMALSSATDMCGHITRYAHTEAIPYGTGISPLQLIFQGKYNLAKFYDDPSSQTNDAGTKSFEYGSWRIMSKSVDELGRTTVNTVDAKGRRLDEKVTDAAGNLLKETAFTYGDSRYQGVLTKKTIKHHSSDPAPWAGDIVTDYSLNPAGNVATETIYAGGNPLQTVYTYDANNNKISSTDPNGNTTAFTYDVLNRLVKTTFANGATKSFAYDVNGNKIRETDENGHVTKHIYDPLNRLTETQKIMGNGLADLVTRNEYNNVNSKTKITDPKGNATTTVYDALQRPIQIIAPATTVSGSAVSGVTIMEYGTNSGGSVFDASAFKPTKITDPNGTVTEVTYDSLYRPLTRAVTYSGTLKAVTTMQYDAVGNAVQTTDAAGNITQTTYDGLNRPVQVIYCKPDGTAMASTTTSFTTTGLKWQACDELGNITETRYDSAGRPVMVLAPSVDDGFGNETNPVTETIYDPAGNVIGIINPLNNRTDYGFDKRNRRVWELASAVVDATLSGTAMVRPLKQTGYDGVGSVVSVIDRLTGTYVSGTLSISGTGAETNTVYDAANRPVSVTGPAVPNPAANNSLERPLTQTAYDANGNVTSVTDPLGRVTANTYDALNRLITTTDAASITVRYEYDLVGNRTKVTDGKGNATLFTYDGLKRNTSVTDAQGQATVFIYDGQNKIQRTDARGQVTQYTYDYRNRLATVSYTGRPTDNRANSYDWAGNLLSVSEPGKNGVADAAYTYDKLKRIVTETSNGYTHSYSYDLAGNRLQTVYGNGGKTLTCSYDALNRLSSMSESGRESGYGYDVVGNIAVKTSPNGDRETATFDKLNRTMTQTAVSGTNLLYEYGYEHDLAGNVTKVVENYDAGLNNRTVNNSYDAINRLKTEAVSGSNGVTTAYTYDAANNRMSKIVTGGSNGVTTGYTYNALNQLTEYSDGQQSVTLGYDANGNRGTRTVSGGTAAGVDTYSYDYENRLVGLVKGAGAASGTYGYVYDYRTRRVVRDETQAGGVETRVVFSGGVSVQEYVNGSTYAAVEYVRGSDYGGGVGGILYTLRGGEASFTHENRRGDVIAKTNASGVLTYQASYEAYGTRTQEQGSTQDRQKANTKDEDPTGLLNEGFRYRDLETGSFITADPLGFEAGPNFYTYVRQNPWTSFDPEGLNEVIVSGGISERSPTSAIGYVQRSLRKAGGLGARIAHDVNWKNFVQAAESNILAKQKSGDTQKIEWLVQRSTYEQRAINDGKSKDEYTNQIAKFATDHKVELRWFNTGKEQVSAINNNSDGKPRQGGEKISDYTQYSHGYPGRMATDLNGDSEHSVSINDVKSISNNAFQANSKSTLFPCNSAQNNGQTSVRDVWETTTGSTTVGVVGRMDYAGKGGASAPAPTEGKAMWSWTKSEPPPKPAAVPTPVPKPEN